MEVSTCHDVTGPWIPSSRVVSVSSRPTLMQPHPDSRAHPVAVAWCAPSLSLKSQKPKHFDATTENHRDAILAYFFARCDKICTCGIEAQFNCTSSWSQ